MTRSGTANGRRARRERARPARQQHHTAHGKQSASTTRPANIMGNQIRVTADCSRPQSSHPGRGHHFRQAARYQL
eukprot:10729366-Alexandrium_andersonii.AAC.1